MNVYIQNAAGITTVMEQGIQHVVAGIAAVMQQE